MLHLISYDHPPSNIDRQTHLEKARIQKTRQGLGGTWHDEILGIGRHK